MPQHQITINWQFKPTEDDSTHLTLNNILGQPNTDARGKSASEDLVRGNHRISKHSLAECLRKNGTVDISIIEAYLEILCAYHNEKHPVAKNKLPKYINLGHSFFDKLSQRPSPNNPNRGLKWGSQRLHEIAPDLEKNDRRASLMDVEHLLVPVMPKLIILRETSEVGWGFVLENQTSSCGRGRWRGQPGNDAQLRRLTAAVTPLAP